MRDSFSSRRLNSSKALHSYDVIEENLIDLGILPSDESGSWG